MRGTSCERLPPTPGQTDRRPGPVRALLESTETVFTVASYRPRAVIFFQGQASSSVMYVETGRIWLSVTAPSGQEGIVGLLEAGAFLGEEALGGISVRQETATATTATEVLVVAPAQMQRLLRTQGAISDRFVAHILARNIRLEADLTDQLLHSSEERLARTLLVLAGCDERRSCPGVLPDVSQEVIANMVGTTRSRVNAFMGKFKKLGLLEEAGGVLQINPARLSVLHDAHHLSRSAHAERARHMSGREGAL
jgi:CRP/FNR family transcriptional regulator, cyclic AMP receptor protein